jgi:hypothetical protein
MTVLIESRYGCSSHSQEVRRLQASIAKARRDGARRLRVKPRLVVIRAVCDESRMHGS